MIVNSKDFRLYPSPQDWKQVLATIPVTDVKPPALNQFEDDYKDYFQKTLTKASPSVPLYAKFCSGLVVSLWPCWIVQLAHISFLGTHVLSAIFNNSVRLCRNILNILCCHL